MMRIVPLTPPMQPIHLPLTLLRSRCCVAAADAAAAADLDVHRASGAADSARSSASRFSGGHVSPET